MLLLLFHYRDMERCGELDPDSECDLFCLHYTFKQLLTRELSTFTDSWNNHGVRTEHNLTPLQLFVGGLQMCTNPSEISTTQFPDLAVRIMYFILFVNAACLLFFVLTEAAKVFAIG